MRAGQSTASANAGRLIGVLCVSVTILLIEVVGGLLSHSLALIADAGHLLTDVSGIALSLLAIWFGARPASRERTFGWYRLEILAAVLNGVLLFGVAGLILVESVRGW